MLLFRIYYTTKTYIYIYILNEPSKDVLAYDEIMFWLDMGWIKLYDENEL